MDIQKSWERALKKTEILRGRIQALLTFSDTHVPYILLSESAMNHGDTVVRRGEVVVQRPNLILPPNIPQFEGFDFNDETVNKDTLINFLYVRGIQMPSLRYDNRTHKLDVFEGSLTAAIRRYQSQLQRQENVNTGLLTGPEDVWQFSLMIFICSQIMRNAQTDIQRLLEEYKKQN